jgi:hypothetical protein
MAVQVATICIAQAHHFCFVHCSISFLSSNVLVRCCDQVEIQRRERPQVATINGVPTLLFTGVNPKSGNCWTQMQRIATK